MRNFLTSALSVAAGALLATAGAAHAQASLWAARVGAQDVEGAAEFYKAAFGMQEVDRLMFPSGEPEIILNFGATLEEAQANSDSHIAIMPREGVADDPVPPLMLYVTDIAATAQAVRDAGGTVDREPAQFGASGASLAFVRDPAGNRIELIQPAD